MENSCKNYSTLPLSQDAFGVKDLEWGLRSGILRVGMESVPDTSSRNIPSTEEYSICFFDVFSFQALHGEDGFGCPNDTQSQLSVVHQSDYINKNISLFIRQTYSINPDAYFHFVLSTPSCHVDIICGSLPVVFIPDKEMPQIVDICDMPTVLRSPTETLEQKYSVAEKWVVSDQIDLECYLDRICFHDKLLEVDLSSTQNTKYYRLIFSDVIAYRTLEESYKWDCIKPNREYFPLYRIEDSQYLLLLRKTGQLPNSINDDNCLHFVVFTYIDILDVVTTSYPVIFSNNHTEPFHAIEK